MAKLMTPYKKPTVAMTLVTDSVCNVQCKTCPTGRRDGGVDAKRMTLEMATRITDKALAEAHVLSCGLYYFNEPLLHPQICDIIEMLHKRKIYVFISTNLSFKPDSVQMERAKRMMELGTENIIVSVSGWFQETYERSHKSGRIEWVKENMATLARLRNKNTFLRLSWHDYWYNKSEAPLMQDFAEALGFRWTPYATGVLPLERVLDRWKDGLPDPAEADILVKLPEAKELCFERKHWNCQMQDQCLTIDANGMSYNCADKNNPTNWRGNFLTDGKVADFLNRRKTDPDCIACKAQGGHVYAAQEYLTPLNSPWRFADRIYRKLNLQPVIQKFSKTIWRKFLVEGFYNRPKQAEK